MTQRNSGSQYMLLAQTLLRQIGTGVYPPESLLPTEQQLCEQFNVSRITVRGAMRELQAKGIISRRAGVGTRVEATRPRGTFIHVGDSIDDILQFTKGIVFHTLNVRDCIVDAALAAELDLPAGQNFIHVTGVRRTHNAPPVVLSQHYVPGLYADVVDQMDGYSASLADLLAGQRGETVSEVVQSIDASRLSAGDARALESRAGSATLRTKRWYFGQTGNLIIASISLFPEGRYAFKSRIRRDVHGHAAP